MIYVGSKNLRNIYEKDGKLRIMSDDEVIRMINTSFGLKNTVTKIILK